MVWPRNTNTNSNCNWSFGDLNCSLFKLFYKNWDPHAIKTLDWGSNLFRVTNVKRFFYLQISTYRYLKYFQIWYVWKHRFSFQFLFLYQVKMSTSGIFFDAWQNRSFSYPERYEKTEAKSWVETDWKKAKQHTGSVFYDHLLSNIRFLTWIDFQLTSEAKKILINSKTKPS